MQAIITLDGLILHLYGPEEGRRHGITLFRHSNIEQQLSDNFIINEREFHIYGDPSYVLHAYM